MHKLFFIPFFSILILCNVQLYAQDAPIEDTAYETNTDEEYTIKDIDTALYLAEHPVPIDSIAHWKEMKGFAYTKYLDSLLREQQQKKEASTQVVKHSDGPSAADNFLSSKGVSVFLWILAGIFVLFILYKLFLTEGIFKKKLLSKDNVLLPIAEEEVVTAESDFDRLIRSAIAVGNYRLAIRYQYLQSLHKLAEKNYVEMAADKTNYNYVQEIKSQQLRNDFAALTLNYEYVWYGEFLIEQIIYQKLENAFSAFNQKV